MILIRPHLNEYIKMSYVKTQFLLPLHFSLVLVEIQFLLPLHFSLVLVEILLFIGIDIIYYTMNMIYVFNEYTNIGNSYLLIDFLFILSLLFAILVIISKNPIVSVLFLIGLFSTVALYLMISDIKFIGLSYLLVYVGAISILFLFILMLINVRISELVTDNNNSVPLSLMVLTIFGITFQDKKDMFNIFNYANNNIYYASSSSWDNTLSEMSHISSIGNILYTSHPMLLFATSLILLLSMIGSIIITLKQES